MPRMLDLFCGRWGWGKAFASAGWEVVGIDLVAPPEIPQGCTFIQGNILDLNFSQRAGWYLRQEPKEWGGLSEYLPLDYFDSICASSPCEQFSVHGMKHFHPNPKYPELGIRLFEHTRAECERSGAPYVMENVRPAQKFMGPAIDHCGPFYLWGSAVPARMPKDRVKKAIEMGRDPVTGKRILGGVRATWSGTKARADATAKAAEIPAVLAQAVLRAAIDPSRRRKIEHQETLF